MTTNHKVEAFVLLKVVPGFEEKALSGIRAIPGVEEVQLVYGQWDAVANVSSDSMHKLTSLLLRQLRGVQGIANTETLIVTSA